jgi:hypothetical protein
VVQLDDYAPCGELTGGSTMDKLSTGLRRLLLGAAGLAAGAVSGTLAASAPAHAAG